jgi:hypothetical protein
LELQRSKLEVEKVIIAGISLNKLRVRRFGAMVSVRVCSHLLAMEARKEVGSVPLAARGLIC